MDEFFDFKTLAVLIIANAIAFLLAIHYNKKCERPLTTVKLEQLERNFIEAIMRSDKPAAMKAYRKINRCGLKEAKAAVEAALSNKRSTQQQSVVIT